MKNILDDSKTKSGTIKIADEVVGIIAGLAASETIGIAGMSGGVVGGIAELLGRKNLAKGVKVEVGEKEAAIDLFVAVDFGTEISSVARDVQLNVKSAVENMTGLKVVEVNVHVQGVVFQREVEKEEEARVR
ncbi:MAG: Asp23/Gls24 family envelope stress response protein [Clostridia bacterium]|nr:Asp23/Gls24 family envelope stress response protein [Clostridia bacterium]